MITPTMEHKQIAALQALKGATLKAYSGYRLFANPSVFYGRVRLEIDGPIWLPDGEKVCKERCINKNSSLKLRAAVSEIANLHHFTTSSDSNTCRFLPF